MGEDGRCWAAVAWGYPKALAGKERWDSRPLISALPCGRPKSVPKKSRDSREAGPHGSDRRRPARRKEM